MYQNKTTISIHFMSILMEQYNSANILAEYYTPDGGGDDAK